MSEYKIGFLGYERDKTNIIGFLEKNGCEIYQTNEIVDENFANNSDIIISFGYKHILSEKFIESCRRSPLNLHISYLPFNRGAHPNFWAFYDKTPHGVSIHEIDRGLDTGDLLLRKKIKSFKDEMTFLQTYNILVNEVENLFMDRWADIKNNALQPSKQSGSGTYHRSGDLPRWSGGWDAVIREAMSEIRSRPYGN